jgi:hypothetical protein
MMVVVRGRGAGVAGRAGAGEHRARREDVEEGQRRLGAPEAERPSEEAGEHLLLFVRCGRTFVVRPPINAYPTLCRTPAYLVCCSGLCNTAGVAQR